MTTHLRVTNPWDVDIEAETEETAYCEVCDITIGDLHTTWITGRRTGEAECPQCEASLEVEPRDNEPDYEWESQTGIYTPWE